MRHKRTKSHIIWNKYHPEDRIEKHSDYHIHHINGNHDDDRIENLQKIKGKEHNSMHSKGENNPMYGKPTYGHLGKKHSEESKEKIRQANLGKKHTKESKKKMSEKRQGENNPFFGKHWDEKNRKRLRENMKERINKVGHPKGFLGKTHSDEYKKFLSGIMAKKVKINGIIYTSIKEACLKTGLSRYIINRQGEFV